MESFEFNRNHQTKEKAYFDSDDADDHHNKHVIR